MANFTLDQYPVPWTAPKGKGKIRYNPKSAKKEATRSEIASLWKKPPIKGYVGVYFLFKFPIPQSYSQKDRLLIKEGKKYPTRIDTTNMQKFYEDCLKGIVIEDDRYVIGVSSYKVFCEETTTGRVYIHVWPNGLFANWENPS